MREAIAVVLKNDIKATEYLTEYLPETEVYKVNPEVLTDLTGKGIDDTFTGFKEFADNIGEDQLSIIYGGGDTTLASCLMDYAMSRRGSFYLMKPKGVVKIA